MAGPPAGAAGTKTADDSAARAKRLTGSGVDSISPRLLFAAQVLIGHTVEAQVRLLLPLCKLSLCTSHWYLTCIFKGKGGWGSKSWAGLLTALVFSLFAGR